MDSTEKKLGTWTLPPKNETKLAVIKKSDDPICPSSGCEWDEKNKTKKALATTVKKSDPICPSSGCE